MLNNYLWKEGRKEGKKKGREGLQFIYPVLHLFVQRVLIEGQLYAGSGERVVTAQTGVLPSRRSLTFWSLSAIVISAGEDYEERWSQERGCWEEGLAGRGRGRLGAPPTPPLLADAGAVVTAGSSGCQTPPQLRHREPGGPRG